jgi:uncharacterized protein YfaS (alpha-2-macroglobulin family)
LADNLHGVPPGLYLLVARGPQAKTETKPETDTETGSKVAPLAPIAAAWMLRSSLHLEALRDRMGIYGIVEKTGAAEEVPKNVRLVVEDANASVLTETHSGTDGVGFLALGADKLDSAMVLAGFTDAGDIDFVDLNSSAVTRFAPPGDAFGIETERPFYSPATPASIILQAHNAEGAALAENGTVLALLGANGDTYASFPVPSLANGAAHVAFPVPAVGGVWPVAWRQGDGRILAQAPLRVTADPAAPRLDMTADRSTLSHDGNLNLTIKSLDADGGAAPYIAGRVFVAWSSPDTLGREWKDYRFSADAHDAGAPAPLVSFVTNDKGVATLHATLVPPDDHAMLHNATLSAQSDPAIGVAPPAPLTLPMKPKENTVGIKPLAPGARFPENGFARFDIITLDADGHRRAADDLDYQVYEEGRSFDWYQADGRWNYKQEQQKRRIGGGALTLSADGDDIIELPVAAGTYRLEITDANGAVRSAIDFSAGSGVSEAPPPRAPLTLASSATSWQPGQEIEARITLDKPSMVTAIVGDDHIRAIIHKPGTTGENTVRFVPGKDWNGPVSLDVQTEDPQGSGHLVFPHATAAPSSKATPAPLATEAVAFDAAMPPMLREGDFIHLTATITNNEATSETVHYALNAATGLKINGANSGSPTIAAGRTYTVPIVLEAIRSGPAALKLDVTSAPHFHSDREWPLPVAAVENTEMETGVSQRIEPQQSTSWPPNPGKTANKVSARVRAKEENLLFLSPTPLYDAPPLLAALLASEPFSTAEIAGTLEVLRLWREPILASALDSEAGFDLRMHDLTLTLLARQKSDGGFPALPGDQPATAENIVSTAQALTALAHSDLPASKPAADRAAAWLQQHLDNSWFDERERPDRAAAYAALAEAGRLDNASLHYFSDTSAKTTIPPLAAIQLALAFSRIGDQPASDFWIDTSGVRKQLAALPPALMPVLARNGFFNAQSILPSMEAFSGKETVKNAGLEAAADFLRAMGMIEDRKGSWRVTVNSDKRSQKGVLAMALPPKTAALIIHNNGNDPVFLFGTQRAKPKTPSAAARRVYELNGKEMNEKSPLARDETYLVVLDGVWPGSSESVLIHDDPGPALRVMGCLPPPPIEADDQLAWLKSQVLTATAACESGARGIDVLLARRENGSAASWRVAYLAKAQWIGGFSVPPAQVYGVTADRATSVAPSLATTAERIDIR